MAEGNRGVIEYPGINKYRIPTEIGQDHDLDEIKFLVTSDLNKLKIELICRIEDIKPLCEKLFEIENVIFVCFVILSTGVAASLISLVAPISSWISFRNTRKIHNYISLNQCITAALLTALICVRYYNFYTYAHTIHEEIDNSDADIGRIKTILLQLEESILTFQKWANIVQAYVLVSMYCWNTAAAVLCYSQVVKVFSREIPRKYLTVNLLCYVAPIPLAGIHGCLVTSLCRNEESSTTDSITIVSVTTILTVVLVSLYVCVAVAICKGRRPGHGETVRAVTTVIIISSIFGLWFCVSFAVWAYFPMTSDISKLDMAYYGKGSQITQCIFLSAHPIAISLMHVLGRAENREKWVKLFCKNKGKAPGIEMR